MAVGIERNRRGWAGSTGSGHCRGKRGLCGLSSDDGDCGEESGMQGRNGVSMATQMATQMSDGMDMEAWGETEHGWAGLK